ncbi:MAG: hypothetical protein NC127_01310 [Muribaculum sp.]|nr:hypothetical protein [Muribaculum sp.]
MENDKFSSGFTEPEDFEYVEPEDDGEVADGQCPAGDPAPVKPKKHRFRRFMVWVGIILLLTLAGAFWIRYINPYVIGAHERGYVVDVQYRGMIFKTWEGEMIAQKALTDTAKVYSHSFLFSVDNGEVARRLEELSGTGKRVTLTYDRYMGALPWRGSQTCIVTGVEPAE